VPMCLSCGALFTGRPGAPTGCLPDPSIITPASALLTLPTCTRRRTGLCARHGLRRRTLGMLPRRPAPTRRGSWTCGSTNPSLPWARQYHWVPSHPTACL